MYNKKAIEELVNFITERNGIGDKETLLQEVKDHFSLTKEGKVFYNDDYAIRFGWNGKDNSKKISNTVLGLSRIRNFDNLPLIFCIVTHEENHLLLINTTFLKKVSHSSKELRMDNIKGSINCSDIMMLYNGLENNPDNFEQLFAFHSEMGFKDNLERLVEATNGIVGRVPKFNVTSQCRNIICESINRADRFCSSNEFIQLQRDLNDRVEKVKGEIVIASLIENVNLRGRIIEYLITDNGSSLKEQIIKALRDKCPIPTFKTEDKLGDYTYAFDDYITETDIKTKVMFLNGNPKAYNIDKLLEFLSIEKSVYMIYLVGIEKNGEIIVRLCSSLDEKLIKATNIEHHWAGRNTRGVAQFIGKILEEILEDENYSVNINKDLAESFLSKLIDL